MNTSLLAIPAQGVVYTQPQTHQQTALAVAQQSAAVDIPLTLRDQQILEVLYTARYLGKGQIQTLFFGQSIGGKKTCERRLRQLYQAGYVRRIEQLTKWRAPRQEYLYTLDKKGAAIVATRLGIRAQSIDYKPKSCEENWPFMDHLLATADLRIAFTLACEQQGIALEWWRDELELRREGMTDIVNFTTLNGKEDKAAIIPDAAFKLCYKGKRSVFLVEIDRGTVTIAPSLMERRGWIRKVRAFLAYETSEVRKVRYGKWKPRILTITTSQKRLDHLREATRVAGGGEQFYFTTFDQAKDAHKLLTDFVWYTVENPSEDEGEEKGEMVETLPESSANPLVLLPFTGAVTRFDTIQTKRYAVLQPGSRNFEVYVNLEQIKGRVLHEGELVQFICRKGNGRYWTSAVRVLS